MKNTIENRSKASEKENPMPLELNQDTINVVCGQPLTTHKLKRAIAAVEEAPRRVIYVFLVLAFIA